MYGCYNTSSKGICSKGNVIARLEFKLTYCDIALLYVNHNTKAIPSIRIMRWLLLKIKDQESLEFNFTSSTYSYYIGVVRY